MFKKKDDNEKKDERVVAKKKLVALLKTNSNVFRALQLPRTAEDHALLQALAKFDSVFDVLRSCGYSIVDASRAGEMLVLALDAPAGKKRKNKNSKQDKMERCAKSIAGFCFLALLAMVSVLVLTMTQATAGWEVGTCSVTMYTNQTCQQGQGQCLVEVMVRGEGAWVVKKGWTLPTAYAAGEGGVPLTKYASEAFRCCNTDVEANQGVVGSCCSMWDTSAQQFCDNWVHRKDQSGKACPANNWACIYQLDPNDEAIVTELKPYVAPSLTPLIASITLAALSLIAIAVAICVRRAGLNINLSSIKLPSRLENLVGSWNDDELETSDEEDPEADVPACSTGSNDDVQQDDKRPGTVKSQRSERSSVVSVAALDFVNTQAEQEVHSQGSKRNSSKLSGSSKQSGSMVSSKNREATLERRYSPDVTALPGVVEGDEAALEEEATVGKPGEESEAANFVRYLAWTSIDKENCELEDDDIHVGFKLGDISRLSARARKAAQPYASPLIEPLGKQDGRSKRGSRQRSRPRSVGAPNSWAWAGQDEANFEGDHVLDAGRRGSAATQSPALRRNRSAPSGRRPRSQGRPTASRSSRGGPSNAW